MARPPGSVGLAGAGHASTSKPATSASTPRRPGVAIAAGDDHSLAVRADGSFWGFGDSEWGQVGDGRLSYSTAPIGLDLDRLPPDQGNVLRAVREGNDVLLDFAGAPATAWRVYRDATKSSLGATALSPDVASPLFADLGAVPRASTDFYRVKGLSPCSTTPGP